MVLDIDHYVKILQQKTTATTKSSPQKETVGLTSRHHISIK